jgi:hypothetical protein
MRSVSLLATALNCHIIADRDILNILSNFCLFLFIDKDELVVSRVSIIIFYSAVPRVIRVFISLYTSISDTKLRRGRDVNEGGCNVGALTIWFDDVDEARDPGKVDNIVIVVDGDGREVVRYGVSKGGDSRHQVISPSLYGIREQGVCLSIAQDGMTQGRSAQYLFWDPKLVSPSLRWCRGSLSGGVS